MVGGKRVKKKGLDFERRVKRVLEDQGYFVIRSAGSKGVADLVALSRHEKLLISCREKEKFTRAERNMLIRKALEIDGKAVLAYKQGREVKFLFLI